jgi:hypothetical protein
MSGFPGLEILRPEYKFPSEGETRSQESRRRAVDRFIKHFVREGDGMWRCVAPAELQVDVGRIQVAPGTIFTRGTMFMGVDLASMLEEHYSLRVSRR